MSREIKFRAWHPEYGEMIYSNVDSEWQDKREWYPICFEVGFSHFPHSITDDRTVLMQYTGLKDKNGKEIYEGDVYKTHNGFKWVVEWDAENAGFYGKAIGEEKNVMLVIDNINFEIIGNIYENPDLLK